MSTAIERLSFGGILDKSFHVLREHFAPLVSLFAVPAICSAIVGLGPPIAGSAESIGLGPWVAAVLIYVAVFPLFALAAIRLAADRYLSRPGDLSGAMRLGRKRYAAYLGTSLLMGLLLVLWGFAVLVPMVYFAVAWSLMGQVVCVEGTTGLKALRRSRSLVRGHWWRTLALSIVAALPAVLIGIATEVFVGFSPLLSGLLGAVATAVTLAFATVVSMVLYIDLRCRHEDFDLELLAEQVETSASAAELPAAG